jgi:hypothetical protein
MGTGGFNAEREIGAIVSVAVLLGIGATFLYYLGNSLGVGNAANAVNQISGIITNTDNLAIIGLVFIVVILSWAWSAYKKSGLAGGK